MNQRLHLRSILAIAVTLVLGGFGASAPAVGDTAPTGSTFRLAGADRYETPVEISQKWFPPGATMPESVYLASGESYADALSVAPVAALRGAPLLLVPRNTMPRVVADEIDRLGPARVFIVGGEGAVSEQVTQRWAGRGAVTFSRIAGADRYETSRRVVEHGISEGVFGARTAGVFVVTGRDYPDALAAGAVAGLPTVAAPVVLTDGLAPRLGDAAAATLRDLPASATVSVVGGDGVVRPSVFADISNPKQRIAGASRYLTSQAVVTKFVGSASQGLFAAASSFADALAGAPYAGASGSALWIVPNTCLPSEVLGTARNLGLAQFGLLGGTGVLSGAVEKLTVCGTAPSPAPGGDTAALTDQVVAITNQERAKAGCPALSVDPRLTASAQLHAADMVANKYFEHQSLDGRSPGARITAQGFTWRTYGENIAAGQKTPAQVMTSWMNSPGHRANILTCDFASIGVGWANNYWVQNFGTEMDR